MDMRMDTKHWRYVLFISVPSNCRTSVREHLFDKAYLCLIPTIIPIARWTRSGRRAFVYQSKGVVHGVSSARLVQGKHRLYRGYICMVQYDPKDFKWITWQTSKSMSDDLESHTTHNLEWIPISCDQWYLFPLVVDVPHEVFACRCPIPNDQPYSNGL